MPKQPVSRKNNLIRKALLLLLIPLLCLLAGCWDRIEIEERAFIIGVAIDKAEQPQEKEEEDEASNEPSAVEEGQSSRNIPETKRGRYSVTFQAVVPEGVRQGGSAKGGQSSSQANYVNISVQGDSLFSASKSLAGKMSRTPYFQHLKLIVVSEELVKESNELLRVMDFFLRENQMRRSVNVMISRSKAAPALESKPKGENFPALYLSNIADSIQSSSWMLPETRIGNLHELQLSNHSYAVQYVKTEKNESRVTGAAIMDGQKHEMKGTLTDEQTQGLNFLTGDVKGGVLETTVKGEPLALEIMHAYRDLRLLSSSRGHFTFQFRIEVEGAVGEIQSNLNLDKAKLLEEAERALSAKIMTTAKDTIRTLKGYRTDVLGLQQYLYENHYNLWKPVSKDWEGAHGYFTDTEIQVHADVKIRRIGNIIQSEK
ncbi:Ger(x)C family spore germination protein [Paenibacillus gansuensis]|uniref:Ger(X)C family spore germination protein n=1 Tax=Paenibacillus gansuensis TaxID=306542 RepID=A0ABW5PBD6_9BACL